MNDTPKMPSELEGLAEDWPSYQIAQLVEAICYRLAFGNDDPEQREFFSGMALNLSDDLEEREERGVPFEGSI